MCIPMAMVGLIASVAGTAVSAVGAYNQASSAKAAAEFNAKQADIARADTLEAGDKEAHEAVRQGRLLAGQQRAEMAARGLDLSSGTPADILLQTDFFSEVDQQTVRRNTGRRANQIAAQAASYRGEASGYNPALAATGSLLGSVGQVSGSWYNWKSGSKGGTDTAWGN